MANPKDVPDAEDVQDVMREEKSRGRRPIDTDVLSQREMLRRDFRKLLRIERRGDFEDAILALGLKRGSPPFETALRIWNESRRS